MLISWLAWKVRALKKAVWQEGTGSCFSSLTAHCLIGTSNLSLNTGTIFKRGENTRVKRVQRICHARQCIGHGCWDYSWNCFWEDCQLPGKRCHDASHWAAARQDGLF